MMHQLSTLSTAESRSISPENFTGAKGKGGMAEEGTGAACARDLGPGWKISPSVVIEAGTTFEMADIEGPGTIEQIWLTRPAIGASAFCGFTGMISSTPRSSVRSAIFSPAVGASTPRFRRWRCVSIRAALSIATGACLFAAVVG